MRQATRFITLASLWLLLSACSTRPAKPGEPPPERAGPGQVLLLGEVHDNAAQHALRQQALATLLALGDRPALLMEAFDRERQSAIDVAMQRDTDRPLTVRVEALIDAGGRAAGWQWPLYQPYIALALQHGLPIVAANVSRAEARRVIGLGLAATGWQEAVPEDIAHAQAAAIEASHCGQVDAALAARLARAQLARDQFMAQQIERHAARGVLLLAGNGHVRTDIGVPRWLPPALLARSRSVGYLEPDNRRAPYDAVVLTAAQPRLDPCATMRPVTPAAAGR